MSDDTDIHFVVYGKAEPAGSKTAGVTKAGKRYYRDANPSAKTWRTHVAGSAGVAMEGRELLTGPILLTLVFYRVRPRSHYRTKHGERSNQLLPHAPGWPTSVPDLTKLVRGVEDGMKGVVFRDDAQIVSQVNTKLYGTAARVDVTIRPMEDP